MILTDAGEWVVEGDTNGSLIPTAINAHQQGFAGGLADVRPILIENSLVYVQARGGRLLDLSFSRSANIGSL